MNKFLAFKNKTEKDYKPCEKLVIISLLAMVRLLIIFVFNNLYFITPFNTGLIVISFWILSI